MSLASGFPAVLVGLILLWMESYPARVQWTLTVVIVGFWLGFSHAVRERVVFPLQTLSNLLAALREGDFSIRARGAAPDDPLGEAMLEVNFLGQILREQRLGALEATALLRTVMSEIEVAVFAFDGDQKLRLVNRAGERLLAQPAERLWGKAPLISGLPTVWLAKAQARSRCRSRVAEAASKCIAVRFASEVRRINCSFCRTSAARFAKKSARRGNGLFVCSVTN